MSIITIPRGEAKPETRNCMTCANKPKRGKHCKTNDCNIGKHGVCSK